MAIRHERAMIIHPMKITLIYPHQLFSTHPAVAKDREIWLIEDPLFFGNDPHWPTKMHVQKLMLHRASMLGYAKRMLEAGHTLHHIEVPSCSKMDSTALLANALPHGIKEMHLADPTDEILLKRVKRYAAKRNISVVVYPTPNFLSPPDFLARHIASGKKPFMASFYEAQRKRMNVLLEEDGSPFGGRWSFDTENRAKLPKKHLPPREPVQRGNDFTKQAAIDVAKKFPDNPGSMKHFRWPVTHEDSAAWLDQFLDERFENFGIYEDAISTEHTTLYHSAITPMLNIGLLDPAQVVQRALEKADKAGIPLNSAEGFIRQIIGWREFMHGIYQHHGTDIRNGNFWQFERSMPHSFYDGTTGIPPVDRVIRQLLDDGWCHHIERLMVLGNFMLLCRIKPDDVYRWFMEMFVDSYDWVMVPNVYGMSQFADGGTFTTKPYLSGSNYILKMSDEPKGVWCEVWDGLFWSFIGDYQPFFLTNPRLSMMARNWQKMTASKQESHRKAADDFLATLG